MTPDKSPPTAPTAPRRTRQRAQPTREAILDAAAELFAKRPPSRVTIRDVAARAGVNHSLVHRHFGTKDNLFKAVLLRGSADYSARIDHLTDPADAFRAGFSFASAEDPVAAATARALLDGTIRPRDGQGYPGMERHIALLQSAVASRWAEPPFPSRLITAAAFALMSGWFLLEDSLVTSAGLGAAGRVELREQVADLIAFLIECASGLGTVVDEARE
jgi:TetR/AcrR family transcriptional regulator, repressor for neighboring sulfatase